MEARAREKKRVDRGKLKPGLMPASASQRKSPGTRWLNTIALREPKRDAWGSHGFEQGVSPLSGGGHPSQELTAVNSRRK